MARALKFSREMMEKALQKKIFKWVDSVMREELPDEVYSTMHQGTITERMRTSRWLQEQGYHIESQPDGIIRVMRGAVLVRESRVVLELTDPDDLLQMAEVSENKNIPPPPWLKAI